MLLQGADGAEELVEKMEDLGLVFSEMTAAQQAVFLMDMNKGLKSLTKAPPPLPSAWSVQRQRERLQTNAEAKPLLQEIAS